MEKSRERARSTRGVTSNVAVQQVMYNAYEGGPATNNNSNSDEPTSNSDLHFYNFNNVTLPKDERVYLPIFSMETKYCDVYHCDIENSTQNYSYYHNANHAQQQQQYEDVWHAIQIKNASKHVWTTAPATVFGEDGKFLAQDTLTYTQIGQSSMVNLTKALDVKVLFEGATAIEQNKGIVNVLDTKYQKDTIKSQIVVTNLKKELVTVVIKVVTLGVLAKSSLEPTSNVEEISYDVANNKRKITWELKIEPGKTVKINYERDILRRH